MLAEKPPALSDARRLSQRVHFEQDGTVSIASGKVELGQGILTALAQIAAEELDVELDGSACCRRPRPQPGRRRDLRQPVDLRGRQGAARGVREVRAALGRAARCSARGGEPHGRGRHHPRPRGSELLGAREPRRPDSRGGRSAGVVLPHRRHQRAAARPAGKLAGRPSYVQDMVLPGMLHGRVVRPPKAFA